MGGATALLAPRNKYGAKRTIVDDIVFASKAEARRYGSLKLMERIGRIADLKLQPSFQLRGVNGGKVGRFTADFEYTELGADRQPLGRVIEDVKSPITAKGEAYRLRLRIFRENYPDLDFREVKGG